MAVPGITATGSVSTSSRMTRPRGLFGCKGEREVAKSGSEYGATNNRMEIMAFRNALMWLDHYRLNDKRLLFVLDSKYVLDAVTKRWLFHGPKRMENSFRRTCQKS